MEAFDHPIEGIFRDGIPALVLRAFAPLYQANPKLQGAVEAARECYFWNNNVTRCIDEDVGVVKAFMQTSETSFRLCPQQSATLLKCHHTEPARSIFFCRDEEWEWRTCLMDKTGVRFWPYANAPQGAVWSNGGQTEDFHLEDRFYMEALSESRRKKALLAIRAREIELLKERKNWLANNRDGTDINYPTPKLLPPNVPKSSM